MKNSETNKVKKKTKKEKKVSIGGQAVLEGVMMRGKSSMAIAVRDADGIIRVEKNRVTPQDKRSLFFRLPIIRGIFSFVQSLFGGTAILMRSAEVYGEEEPSKFEKWFSKTFRINIMNVISGFSLILGLLLAVFLFVWLPQFLRTTIENIANISFGLWAKNFIEGGIKLLIFISYILLCSLLKDIKRTFMYHGAEHKTIACYEKGLPLTVENAKKCSRLHDRCGTTFIVFVLVISILVFACFESAIGQSLDGIVRVLCKIVLLPIVAGLSYELLKALAKTSSPLVLPIKAPGLLLQKITTREPDDSMLEVAITSFNAVLEMDNDPSVPEQKFVTAEKRKTLTERVAKELSSVGITEKSEAEWIVSLTLNIKRDEVYSEKIVTPKYIEKVNGLVAMRKTGRPLWYCIGDTDFYGFKIKVDERVLIPRPETELLVENALKYINADCDVLDLCTGSGAIAIAIKKTSNARVTATDVQEGALEVAKANAQENSCEISFVKSDMFLSLGEVKFDLIISNPPYIKSDDIANLQKEVKDFEPLAALDGGKDGLDFYRIIARNAKNYLKDNGKIFLEVGYNQAKEVKELFSDYKKVEIIKDYENIDRIVKAEI